jgi:hypothetical protein
VVPADAHAAGADDEHARPGRARGVGHVSAKIREKLLGCDILVLSTPAHVANALRDQQYPPYQ